MEYLDASDNPDNPNNPGKNEENEGNEDSDPLPPRLKQPVWGTIQLTEADRVGVGSENKKAGSGENLKEVGGDLPSEETLAQTFTVRRGLGMLGLFAIRVMRAIRVIVYHDKLIS